MTPHAERGIEGVRSPAALTGLDDFVGPGSSVPAAAGSRHNRIETERFKSFTCDDLMKRDKVGR